MKLVGNEKKGYKLISSFEEEKTSTPKGDKEVGTPKNDETDE